MSEKMHSESADHEALTAEPNEADRVEFQESAKTPEVPEESEKCVSKKKKTIAIFSVCGVACIVLVVALVVAFSGPKMPDLVGEKPYDAWVKLTEVIPEDQIAFQTQDEFPAPPEKESDYSQWVVAGQSVSPGATIGSNVVTVTIEPNEEYAAQRTQIVEKFIDTNSDESLEITYDDLGNVLILTMTICSENQPYYPIGFSPVDSDPQKEANTLAASLDCNVILLVKEGDWVGWIYTGSSAQSPNSSIAACDALVNAINDDAITFAKENRIRALENHLLYFNSIGLDAEYKAVDSDHIYITYAPKSHGSYNMVDGEIQDGQSGADSAALYTRANITCTYLNERGETVKTYYGSPTSFIIDPSTGNYIP